MTGRTCLILIKMAFAIKRKSWAARILTLVIIYPIQRKMATANIRQQDLTVDEDAWPIKIKTESVMHLRFWGARTMQLELQWVHGQRGFEL